VHAAPAKAALVEVAPAKTPLEKRMLVRRGDAAWIEGF
jgi:hypothetical protein